MLSAGRRREVARAVHITVFTQKLAKADRIVIRGDVDSGEDDDACAVRELRAGCAWRPVRDIGCTRRGHKIHAASRGDEAGARHRAARRARHQPRRPTSFRLRVAAATTTSLAARKAMAGQTIRSTGELRLGKLDVA